MHGHLPAPPQPRPATTALVVLLRVVLVTVTVLSLGILSWTAMLRIAILRRRPLDWVLFWVSCALVMAALVQLGTGPDDEPGTLGYISLAVLFCLAAGVSAHYLIADIRHHRVARGPVAAPPPPPFPAPGYAPAPPPYGFVPRQPHPPAYSQPQQQQQAQQPQQPQQPLRPQRIDRVRAELDELSDYLRKEQGR
ncbi:hypothetical protein PS467_17775 [Streptomyces luomodiensis]|uniref:Integral membrane protein n=1 Tax=Streptomyces luomodiensis TaxID=3026192 RepID=A0ABY9UZ02_9ACTN|nr:hypothetical protein [Streptomyces sp. SCA4-21]WNE97050.1 hypothetical protein PS467_17775 [Streptomyces sp. SCA4-21]